MEKSIDVTIELMDTMLKILKSKGISEKIKATTIKKFDVAPDIILEDADIRKEYFDHFVYLLNKFLHGYKSENVKQIIYYNIDNYLVPFIEEGVQYFNNLQNEIKQMDYNSYNKSRNYLIDQLNLIIINLFDVFAELVDFYFLRRFLDKKYITNTIIYSGAAHSVVYIYILRSIGFKITHCANCIIQDMTKLNNTVSDVPNFPFNQSKKDLINIFVQSYENPQQCSDLTKFPKLFK